MNRRVFLGVSAAAAVARGQRGPATEVPPSIKALKPMTSGVQPITVEERRARIQKAQQLMAKEGMGAVYMHRGTSMFYYTGTRNLPRLIIPAKGEIVWVVPATDEARVHTESRVGGKVVAYAGDAAGYGTVRQALKDAGATGKVGMEEQTPFSAFVGLRKEMPSADFVNATPVTAGCRIYKSKAEIALMQRAADVTIEAYKAGLATLREGMTPRELTANIDAAYTALGFRGDVSVSFAKNTAFPHGSTVAQTLHEGDMILLDDGCAVDGYQSDITRAVVFGKPSDLQRQIWNIERKAQDAGFAAARLGAPCEAVDIAARKVITDAGFAPGYKVPGLPHRTGHGIGLDIHEWTYLVKGNKTPLAPGMCFSDEPMLVHRDFGVRLEDCFHMTEDGAKFFTKQSPSIEQPFA